jgi:hypothetical protein
MGGCTAERRAASLMRITRRRFLRLGTNASQYRNAELADVIDDKGKENVQEAAELEPWVHFGKHLHE